MVYGRRLALGTLCAYGAPSEKEPDGSDPMHKLAPPPADSQLAQPNPGLRGHGPEQRAEIGHSQSRFVPGHLNLPNSLTLAGLCAGILSCWLALQAKPGPALVALMAAGLFDLFDGLVARRSKRTVVEARFGSELDSLVDMASFGVVPIVIALQSGLTGALDLGILAGYGCAAATRLAHFNSQQSCSEIPRASYTGLPVTYAALIFPCVFVALDLWWPLASQGVVRGTFLAVGLAFVARFNCPKPRGLFYVVFPMLAVPMSIFLVTGYGKQ